MKGTIHNLVISGCKCSLYLPDEYGLCNETYPVIYVNGEDDVEGLMKGVEPHLGVDSTAFMLLGIPSGNWDDDFTPWPAPALTRKSRPFGGKAPDYLRMLESTIKPYMDANYRTKGDPEHTALIGYSLGGLTALFGLYTSDAFGKIGSMSGSLWYDDWTEFMESNMPRHTDATVYLSLGKGEEHSRNPRMARVGDCTRRAVEILSGQLLSKGNITLEWSEGGHFTEIPERFRRAILWLMKEKA
jgi:predicted alpha/beta superfamily hydrolase